MTVIEQTTTRLSRRTRFAAPVIGLAGIAFTFAFSWIPSLWYDEAATVSAATRSLPQLLTMVRSVDLVHGLYYLGMHFWFDLVGYSPITLRLPSAIAVGVTATVIVVLVRQLSSERVALLAGVIFCLLPRVTWAGTEGRSYAFTALLAAVLTLVFAVASRSSGTGWWILYAVLAALSVAVFVYLALLVIAHGVTAVLRWRSDRRGRPLIAWLVAAGVAGIAAAPFVELVSKQSGQVGWIRGISWSTLYNVLVGQWFLEAPWFAALAWALLVAGILVTVRRGPALVVLPWFALPTLGLLAVTLLATPLYSARYVTFCAPAAAILMAIAVDAIPRRPLRLAVLALCLTLTVPTWVLQRTPTAKQDAGWNQVAATVATVRATDPANTSAAVLWGTLHKHPGTNLQLIAIAYPAAFTGLTDVGLQVPAAETGRLWETNAPLDRVASRLDGVQELWLITPTDSPATPATLDDLADRGFTVTRHWSIATTQVSLYRR